MSDITVTETTKTVPVWTVNGEEFLSPAKADARAAELRRLARLHRYWVWHSFHPDAGFQSETLLLAPSENAALQHCFCQYGPAIVEEYGRACDGWRLTRLTAE